LSNYWFNGITINSKGGGDINDDDNAGSNGGNEDGGEPSGYGSGGAGCSSDYKINDVNVYDKYRKGSENICCTYFS